MKYVINIRPKDVNAEQQLIVSEETYDQTEAFELAHVLLESHDNCFAEIVNGDTDELISTVD